MNYKKLGREAVYALRHAPERYQLKMDESGFVPVADLLSALNGTNHYGRKITKDDLLCTMRESNKQRLEISGEKIRALYGHSIKMKIEKTPAIPPDVLYHGTSRKFLNSIFEKGLLPMKRQHVHLSADKVTAQKVGARHDCKPLILKIDAKAAHDDGGQFYDANDKTWLCDALPAKYIKNFTTVAEFETGT